MMFPPCAQAFKLHNRSITGELTQCLSRYRALKNLKHKKSLEEKYLKLANRFGQSAILCNIAIFSL